MALASIHLPTAPDSTVVGRTGAASRPRRLLPTRRRRFERLDRRGAPAGPSDIALRSVGHIPGLHR